MEPERVFYPTHPNPATEVAINSTLKEDLYIILSDWNKDGSATFKFLVNPLVVKERLTKGESKEEILQYFVGIYGEKVLAAPPARKFNILAWVTPFLAVLAGGLLIYTVLDKWVFYNRLETDHPEAKDEIEEKAELEQYREQLEQEMKKFR